MEINIKHDLPQDKALDCAKKILTQLSNSTDIVSNPVQDWQNNNCNFSFAVKGATVKGQIQVLADRININSRLPLSLSIFKSIIKDNIDRKSQEFLESCK